MKKALKRSLIVLLALTLVIILAIPAYISYWRSSSTIDTFHSFSEPGEISFTDIKWEDGSLGKEKIERISFLVPVKIEGLKGNLFMQFDSGTQTTLIYGKTLDQLLSGDNSVDIYYNEDSLKYLRNPVIGIAESQFAADKIRIAKTLGTTTIDSSQVLIGTLGFDVFVDRTLIMDFKNDKLAITEKSFDDLNYNLNAIEDASVDRFPVLIPVEIGDMQTRLFYDTGASMFSLITSNQRLDEINDAQPDSLCCITNWGKQLPVYRKKLSVPIKIGSSSFNGESIYSGEVMDIANYVPSWYLYGMTGNRLFNNKIVVIDTKNNKFGIED